MSDFKNLYEWVRSLDGEMKQRITWKIFWSITGLLVSAMTLSYYAMAQMNEKITNNSLEVSEVRGDLGGDVKEIRANIQSISKSLEKIEKKLDSSR